MDKKPVKALPQVPPPSSTAAPSAGRTSMSSRQPNDDPQALQQQQQFQRPSTSSSSSNENRLSMQGSRRSSAIPRPAPIPLPQPVNINLQSSLESSGAGDDNNPSSTSSTGSALASVSAELVQPRPPPRPPRHHDSNSGSPTSPKETSTLLDQSSTPRSSSSPHVPTMNTNNTYTKVTILGSSTITTSPPSSATPRPRSAVDSSTSARSAAGVTTTNEFGAVTRPYSSADHYQQRPSSAHSLSGDGVPTHAHTMNNNGGGGARSQSPSADSLLKASTLGAVPRSRSTNFIGTPSPLNPNASSISPTPIPRPYSTATNGGGGSRPGSMVLYRLAGIGDDPQMSSLSPPVTLNNNSRRASRFSTLSSSSYSIFGDSKYPVPAGEDGTLTPPPQGVFLAYEYDPSWDQEMPDDEEDELHKPDEPGKATRGALWSTRGALNICVMVTILFALVFLFALYPVISHFDSKARAGLFTGTDHSNNPGGGGDGLNNSYTRTRDELIDPDTPEEAKTRDGFDGQKYNLVFSDEFKMEGRTFKSSADPFWEAVDLYDQKNADLNWYDTDHVTTKGGHMVITMEEKPTNNYNYVSSMVQSWNKFCFTGGYIEVAVSLPGNNQVFGFTPQVYTMGNLARSGYQATEEGVLSYSYDMCDGGVAPNQGGSALAGQRLSACTCDPSGREYPGPNQAGLHGQSKGRGAPQIDVLGYLDEGQDVGMVSQSLRVAPMSDGRLVQDGQTIRSAADSQLNPYTGGGANPQVISALTNVPAGSYTEGGAQFTAFGYEHTINTANPGSSSIHWSKGNTEVYRVTGAALAADGVGVEQRLISEEPMYIVMSLALSQAVTTVTPTSLTFPAQFLIDYVRVYQPEGQDPKVTCDPTDFPTADYISNHERAYTDATQTNWGTLYEQPLSSYRGEC